MALATSVMAFKYKNVMKLLHIMYTKCLSDNTVLNLIMQLCQTFITSVTKLHHQKNNNNNKTVPLWSWSDTIKEFHSWEPDPLILYHHNWIILIQRIVKDAFETCKVSKTEKLSAKVCLCISLFVRSNWSFQATSHFFMVYL